MDLETRRVFRLATAVSFVFMLNVGVFSQTNRITGQIYGESRRPVSEVYVELLNEVNTVLSRTRTTGAGTFQFSGMSAGKFIVLARPFGTDYQEQSQEVEIVNIVQGNRRTYDAVNIEFFLRPRKERARIGSSGVVFAQEVPADAQKLFDTAIGEFEANRTENGITQLEAALRVFPEYYYALDRLGSEMLKKQQYAESQKYFERAVAINAKSSNSWYGLAFTRYAQNQTEPAIEAGRTAAILAPENSDISLMFGIALRRGKHYLDAEKAMLKAKKLSNGLSADTSWNLALLYVYNLKNNRLAAEELENYLKIKPDHPDGQRIRRLISQLRLG